MFSKILSKFFPKKQEEKNPDLQTLERLGRDQDGRGTHWEISHAKTPAELLEFCIAAHRVGAQFVHVAAPAKHFYINPTSVFTINRCLKNTECKGETAGNLFFSLLNNMRILSDPNAFDLLAGIETDPAFFAGYEKAAREFHLTTFRPKSAFQEEYERRLNEALASVSRLRNFLECQSKTA